MSLKAKRKNTFQPSATQPTLIAKFTNFLPIDLKSVFNLLEIDENGLTKEDYKIIKIMYENYHNKPVSLKSIAIFLNESVANIEYLYEPYLIHLNILLLI